MKRAIAAVLALVATAGPSRAEAFDVDWFRTNTTEREDWLRRCHGDARFFDRFIGECRNAEAADAGTLGRPLQGRSMKPPRMPFPMTPRGQPRAT